MDQRRDLRWAANTCALITVYGAVDRQIEGLVRNVSTGGIGLDVNEPILPGAAVKIQIADSMLLGEVIYCRADNERYYAGVELDQALHGLVELSRNVREFGGPSGAEQTDTVQYACEENQKQPH